jgi:hypothetical protein
MPEFEEFNKISREIIRNSEKYKENFVNNFHSADCELRKPHGTKCTCGFVKKPTKEEKLREALEKKEERLREALEKCVDWMQNNTVIDADWEKYDKLIEMVEKVLEK